MRDTRHLPPETMGNFVEVDVPALITVDRSTLDRYATCPMQARLIEAGKGWLPTRPMAVGTAVHDAFSQAIQEHVDSRGVLNQRDLVQVALDWLTGIRPDLQPEAFQAARGAVWEWARLILSIHPDNLLRFDGGSGERSGQLAWDIEGLGCTPTAEVDLLYAGPSKVCLHECDYKSGRQNYTAAMVRASFQFQLHAYLVLMNYQDVQALETVIWMTGTNRRTHPVEFTRKDLEWISPLVRSVCGEWKRWHEAPLDTVPAWPVVDKCSTCPVCTSCPAACVHESRTITELPDLIAATAARLSTLEKLASAVVDERGDDLLSAHGNAWGTCKPASSRKKIKSLYAINLQSEAQADDNE